MLDRQSAQGSGAQLRRLPTRVPQCGQCRLVGDRIGPQPGDGFAQTLDELAADQRREVELRRLTEAQDQSLVDRRATSADVGQARDRRALRHAGRALDRSDPAVAIVAIVALVAIDLLVGGVARTRHL